MPITAGATTLRATSAPNRRSAEGQEPTRPAVVGAAGMNGSPRQAQLGGGGEEVAGEQRRRAGGQRAQRAAHVDEAAARGLARPSRRGARPAASMSARVSSGPSRIACGPVSHRNPSRRSLRSRPPGRSLASTSVTSCPRTPRKWAQTAPEIPPPTMTTPHGAGL